MTEQMKVTGKQFVEWSLRTVGAVSILIGSAVVSHLFTEIQRLQREQVVIQTQHAALSARVSSEREDTLRSLNRIETTVNKIDSKIDSLKDGK